MNDPTTICPHCGAVSLPIKEAFASMPPALRMQWKTELGPTKRGWLLAFTFGWILVLGGFLFLWIARHDPVNEGRVDAVSTALIGGSLLCGVWLFAISFRDWKEAKSQSSNHALMSTGRYCGPCSLVWDRDQEVRLQD